MRSQVPVGIMLFACAGSPLLAQSSLLIRRAEVPKYPAVALAARLVGTVQVDVTVRGGVIADLHVRPSRVSQGFVEAALSNIRSWEFVDPVDTTFVTTYIFQMSRRRTNLPENPRIEMRLPHCVRLTGNRTAPTTIGDPAPLIVKPPLGRTLEHVAHDSVNFVVTATEYDGAGRTWKPYNRATAGYDPGFSANATNFYSTYLGQTQAKPYAETQYTTDPLDRVMDLPR